MYIEKDGALAGFAWGVIAEKGWVGLHLKADNSYRGLSRFLHVERAKMFSKLKRFTIGTGAAEEGIVEYKKSLHPNEEIDLYHLLTGSKVNSL